MLFYNLHPSPQIFLRHTLSWDAMYIPIQMDDCWILQSEHLGVKGFLCRYGCLMLMAQPVAMVLAVRSARVKGFFCHSGCVMSMAQPVVMMLAVRSSVIIKTLLLIMK